MMLGLCLAGGLLLAGEFGLLVLLLHGRSLLLLALLFGQRCLSAGGFGAALGVDGCGGLKLSTPCR